MKIRNGFVTNSSSSSYIISVKNNNKNRALINMLNFLNEEGYFEYSSVIEEFNSLGTALDIQKKIKGDEFWGHDSLKNKIEKQDTNLLGKDFYEIIYSRNIWEFSELLSDLLEATDGIEIVSAESY